MMAQYTRIKAAFYSLENDLRTMNNNCLAIFVLCTGEVIFVSRGTLRSLTKVTGGFEDPRMPEKGAVGSQQ